jgi:hypothetical protein
MSNNMKFLRHVGGVFLNDKAVVAYTDGDNFELVAETTGGKRVCYTTEERETRRIPAMRLTREQFEVKLDQWTAGLHNQDARIVERALDDMTPADALSE